MHVHVGALEVVVFLLTLVIVGAGWRTVAGHLARSDSSGKRTIGEAMAYVY